MHGRVAQLYRHPVKGFTPEPLTSVRLAARAHFPGDRLYAVEMGPCGYDPAAPTHIPKSRLAVLANTAMLARVRTAYDEASGRLSVELEGQPRLCADLATSAGRESFAGWLTCALPPQDVRGPMRVLTAARRHRFMDDPSGEVSVINLESVRDLGLRLGVPVDPLRFRANLYVDGWPAWSELDMAKGRRLSFGAAVADVVKPIVRCAATHVDPHTGRRDIDMVAELRRLYGHALCGLYLSVAGAGRVSVGDPAALDDDEPSPDAAAAAALGSTAPVSTAPVSPAPVSPA